MDYLVNNNNNSTVPGTLPKRTISNLSSSTVPSFIKTKTMNSKKRQQVFVDGGVPKRVAKETVVVPTYERVGVDPISAAATLREHGHVVIPIRDLASVADRGAMVDAINKDISKFPEFKTTCTSRFPLGGFGAFNNPSSFHCSSVRIIRMMAYIAAAPVLDELKPDDTYKKEMIIDRLAIRQSGTTPSEELWHRDEAPSANDNDIILGGWVNLDEADQVFSCVPKTHNEVSGHSGFGVIKDKSAIAFYNAKRVLVVIPPGHMVMFIEKIVHEVIATKKKYNSYRLFTSWRLTTSNESLHGDEKLDSMLATQAAVVIKSNQLPPMWAKLHWTNWVDKLATYSQNFAPECVERATVKSGKNAGRVVERVHRHMKSLQEYGFPMYERYSTEEVNFYKPH